MFAWAATNPKGNRELRVVVVGGKIHSCCIRHMARETAREERRDGKLFVTCPSCGYEAAVKTEPLRNQL